MKLCIDLCSGLEGFSLAFKQSKDWRVITIDIERKFKPTIVADIRFLPLKKGLNPEMLLMSPPCERFSLACHTWPKMGVKRAMELIGACLEAVAELKPKYWILENPMGRLRWFLGKPGQTIRLCDYGTEYQKKTDLWGNLQLPLLMQTRDATRYLRPFHSKKKEIPYKITQSPLTWMTGHNKAARSKMPEKLSRAILTEVSVLCKG